jgi:hypothetical protein
MRQFRPQKSVQPSSGQGAHNSDDHHSDTIPDEREKRSGTGSGQRPTQAEDRAADGVTNAVPQGLGRNRDGLARDGLQTSVLNECD